MEWREIALSRSLILRSREMSIVDFNERRQRVQTKTSSPFVGPLDQIAAL